MVSDEPETSIFLKKREDKLGLCFYTHTWRNFPTVKKNTKEAKSKITKDAYHLFLKQRDPKMFTMQKRVTVFICNNVPFIVDELWGPDGGGKVTILRFEEFAEEAEMGRGKENFVVGDLLEIGKDVSRDVEYRVSSLSMRERKGFGWED